ncbi:MAG: histidine--tRNA ligase, partial [Gammaproteobacteria bacterium]|nr:histidine--tRNA ligase [Gammaproteobacteria bacterium]
DYYTQTVFEWVTEKLGAQGTICAGGRYDGLVTQFGGQPTPAFGFAAGLERLVLLLEAEGKSPRFQQIDAYFVLGEDDLTVPAFVVANEIRKALPNFQLMMNMGGGSFKNQLKRADKTGAALALILGSEEWAQGGVAVKFLRESRDQVFVKRENIVEWLRAQVGGNHGILYE